MSNDAGPPTLSERYARAALTLSIIGLGAGVYFAVLAFMPHFSAMHLILGILLGLAALAVFSLVAIRLTRIGKEPGVGAMLALLLVVALALALGSLKDLGCAARSASEGIALQSAAKLAQQRLHAGQGLPASFVPWFVEGDIERVSGRGAIFRNRCFTEQAEHVRVGRWTLAELQRRRIPTAEILADAERRLAGQTWESIGRFWFSREEGAYRTRRDDVIVGFCASEGWLQIATADGLVRGYAGRSAEQPVSDWILNTERLGFTVPSALVEYHATYHQGASQQ